MIDEFYNFDPRRNISVKETKEEALDFSAALWIDIAGKAIQKKGVFNCALSGGSTPKAIFQRLVNYKDRLDFSKVQLFLGDERCVDINDPESNCHNAWENGFKELVEWNQMHPMYQSTEEDPEEAALRYEKELMGVEMDLIMLGIGTDGHTASLFPETHALKSEGRRVVANFLPEKEVWRITLTFEEINKCANTIFYVFGADKAETVKKIFSSPYEPLLLPSQKIGTMTHPSLWILDSSSAALLV